MSVNPPARRRTLARVFQLWRRIRYQRPVVDPDGQLTSDVGARRPLRQMASQAVAAVWRYGWRGAVDRLRRYGVSPDPRVDYPAWCDRHTPDEQALAAMAEQVGQLAYRPLISIITPVWNTDPRWLRACVESVRRQVYPHWQLCLADDASQDE